MKKVLSHRQQFKKYFDEFAYKHNRETVWRDFIAGAACSFAEAVIKIQPTLEIKSTIENEFARMRNTYSQEEIDLFAKMLAEIIMEFEESPNQTDVLGELWAEMEIVSKSSAQRMGQFFTPFHVSEAMAKMTLTGIGDMVEEYGFVRVTEPTCGAGGMIIAASKVLLEEGYNPQQQMHIVAQDLDLNCVLMTYIQLTLLGIPALVIHGDTLRNEQCSVWPTFMHMFGHWDYRLRSREENNVAREAPMQVQAIAQPAIMPQQLQISF